MSDIVLEPHDRELIKTTLEDLIHIAKETNPECDDPQLRRVSVQLRRLLVDDALVRSWKLLKLDPKSPSIVAPRLRTDGMSNNDLAVAGGGNIGGMAMAFMKYMPGRAMSQAEAAKMREQEKNDLEHNFSLSEFKDSCSVFFRGQKVNRQQLIQYVANKKGGAHLDRKRKKDEQAFVVLDSALVDPIIFGGKQDHAGEAMIPGKNAVYFELLSIGQNLVNSPDIQKFMAAAEKV